MVTQQQLSRQHYLKRKLRYKRIGSTALGGFLTVGMLAFWSQDIPLLIPPFGATCVIAFVIPDSAYASPRSIIGGHCLSSLIGLGCLAVFGPVWWSYAIAVGLAMLCMQLTRTLHPPAAADSILFIQQGSEDWAFTIMLVLLGTLFIVLFAKLFGRYALPHRHA